MSGHGSTLCSPTVEKILCRSPISERLPVSGLRQAKKQRETGVKRVETAGVYPLAHRRGCGEPCAEYSQIKITETRVVPNTIENQC